ncbi:Signal recognition particle GTPase [Cupriavidus taiwanensis]|uniref:Signal recognition particle receptor FtsY n=1 Tax=Cupriavidus taiwanensis TaxID=164546 RepID=A0A375E5S2_9BURK|nr:signal recognition particle-docking protein FtsY [Cupriavidus taiwanensis]SOZ15035.1 Signal recognition particle GTPase [Cupriavidus taiwanensis]SOZ27117.1 Signal recognition particle GTPase [Cupriavidus taiwanensis]SOZ45608.1 Signal recognition particle GTPase [Cupriavidus taiwanensis]SOZ59898.1 Signal recognition particle GTPase [Cupriavidus taiwanensis]SOZ60177.1 Signal recognition particle GTPase [Cupriavidus taiwanensis]
MFSFWKKRKAEPTPVEAPVEATVEAPVAAPAPAPEVPAPAPAPSPTPTPSPTPAPAPVPVPVPVPVPAQVPPPAPAPVAAEALELVPPPAPSAEARQGWMQRLRTGLSKTSRNLGTLFVGVKVDEGLFEELETALLMADAGVEATEYLLGELRKRVRSERIETAEGVKAALRELLTQLLRPLEKTMALGREQPLVMMIAGVNGAGKTTSIGKLCKHFQRYDQKVLLAAGDTFRAAAREQLAIWGERNNVTVVAQESGDPAAVIFDAVNAAKARGIDIVMADTAGRLPTQLHLMEELKKVKRVISKAMPSAPHEVLLVIDANTGQNALQQTRAFDDALGLTGLIVTKLDGTAKGGILAAIARQRPVPVYFIGVGEKVEDLQPFKAEEFAEALLG